MWAQVITVAKIELIRLRGNFRVLVMLILLPALLEMICAFTLRTDIRNMVIAFINPQGDHRALALEMNTSEELKIFNGPVDPNKLAEHFRKGDFSAALIFDSRKESGKAQLIVDGSNPAEAQLIAKVIENHYRHWQAVKQLGAQQAIDIRPDFVFNPSRISAFQYVNGMLAVVIMLICVMMSSSAIVSEKERGEIDFFRFSAISPLSYTIGKLLPYLLISVTNVCLLLCLNVWVLGLPCRGNIFLVVALCLLMITTCLSIGVFLASLTSSHQMALLGTLLLFIIPTMMLTGFLFPLANLGRGLRWLGLVMPSSWFFAGVQQQMLEGRTTSVTGNAVVILFAFTLVFFVLGWLKIKYDLK